NEGPQHEVTISKPFHIGVYEVTQGEYEKVAGTNPSNFNKANGGGPDHPVEMVSWDDAGGFCKKLSEMPGEKKAGRNYRRPTEAEWEYACRAGTRTAYYFGEDASKLGEYAWYADNSQRKTHPVGQKSANSWGLYDMHGNVAELCGDKPRAYTAAPATNPAEVPDRGSPMTVRCGSWKAPDWCCRSASRPTNQPGRFASDDWGFRVVCDVSAAETGK